MTGRHPFSELRDRMSTEAKGRIDSKVQLMNEENEADMVLLDGDGLRKFIQEELAAIAKQERQKRIWEATKLACGG